MFFINIFCFFIIKMPSHRLKKVRKPSRSRKVRKSSRSRKVRKSSRSRKVRKSSRSRKVRKPSRSRKQFDGAKKCNYCDEIFDDSNTTCPKCGNYSKLKTLSDYEQIQAAIHASSQRRKEKEELRKEKEDKEIQEALFESYKKTDKPSSSSYETAGELRETWVHPNFSEIHSVMMAYLAQTNDKEPFYLLDRDDFKKLKLEWETGKYKPTDKNKMFLKSNKIPSKDGKTIGPRDTFRFIICDMSYLKKYEKYEKNLKKFREEILDSKTVSIFNRNILFDILGDLLNVRIYLDELLQNENTYDKSVYIKSTKEGYCIPLVDGKLKEFPPFANAWREGMLSLAQKSLGDKEIISFIGNIWHFPEGKGGYDSFGGGKGEGKGYSEDSFGKGKSRDDYSFGKGKEYSEDSNLRWVKNPSSGLNRYIPDGFDFIRVPGDGACLFGAIATGIGRNGQTRQIRNEIVQYIRENPEKDIGTSEYDVRGISLENLITFDAESMYNTVDSYCDNMNKYTTYGGNIELLAAARLYRRYEFHVYRRFNAKQVYRYGYEDKIPIFLVYSGNHYDLLNPKT
jgi:hypothetical protein